MIRPKTPRQSKEQDIVSLNTSSFRALENAVRQVRYCVQRHDVLFFSFFKHIPGLGEEKFENSVNAKGRTVSRQVKNMTDKIVT